MNDGAVQDDNHAGRMDRMYRYQRHIYDATRKYYLLGRDRMIAGLAVPRDGSVLEIGCGTGRNLALIGRRYPGARLFGLDISAEMLISAQGTLEATGAKLRVADATDFSPAIFDEAGFDRVVISYALSMIPDWETALDAAIAALKPGGSLHIADFGEQEGLPVRFRVILRGWLARFHVSPRADLPDAVRLRAMRNGAQSEIVSVGRGYAVLAVYRNVSGH